jgi:hypothetical protein
VQGKVRVVVVQVGAVKIYVTVVEVLREKERQDETQCRYHQNWWKNLVWVPVISFKKEGGKPTKIGGKASLGLSYFV